MASVRKKGRFCSDGIATRKFNLLSGYDPSVHGMGEAEGDTVNSGCSRRTGRRIIEMGYLADQLICVSCSDNLHLRDIFSETKFGLASILKIKCRTCGFVNSVSTGKRHKTTEDGNNRFFDVNTKLASDMRSDVLQIAAKEMSTGEILNRYVMPARGAVPRRVAALTSMECMVGKMYHHGKEVPCCSPAEACDDFKSFISKFGTVVLCAHNVSFDAKIIFNLFNKLKINTPALRGYADSLALFRREFPDRKKCGLSYKQVDLVKDILHCDYKAYDAVADVNALCDLIVSVQNYEDKFPLYSCQSIQDRVTRLINLKSLLPSFNDVIRTGVLTRSKVKSLKPVYHYSSFILFTDGQDKRVSGLLPGKS